VGHLPVPQYFSKVFRTSPMHDVAIAVLVGPAMRWMGPSLIPDRVPPDPDEETLTAELKC
jgi:hypothetical protein